MSAGKSAELPSGQLICLDCGRVLDKVVASFAVLEWDPLSNEYSKVADVGDFACAYCGGRVSEEKFHPPEESAGTPFPSSPEEWDRLGQRIKDARPYDYGLHTDVNWHVGRAQEDIPAFEDSKRWLTRKAGELNIG